MFESSETFTEKVVELKRVIKVVKGGKRLKLYACVVVGDGAGNVGVGHAKSAEVAAVIKKAEATGMILEKPPISRMSRVWVRS